MVVGLSSVAIDRAANKAATSPANSLPAPTEAQKESGRYRKGEIRIQGLNIAIGNPKGSKRQGTDRGGKKWSVTMPAHYGYVRRTKGADGDEVDVYVGGTPQSQTVFVVDQVDADTKKFDEHKAFIGYKTRDEVRKTYDKGFSDNRGPARRKAIVPMSIDDFRTWLSRPRETTKAAVASLGLSNAMEA